MGLLDRLFSREQKPDAEKIARLERELGLSKVLPPPAPVKHNHVMTASEVADLIRDDMYWLYKNESNCKNPDKMRERTKRVRSNVKALEDNKIYVKYDFQKDTVTLCDTKPFSNDLTRWLTSYEIKSDALDAEERLANTAIELGNKKIMV